MNEESLHFLLALPVFFFSELLVVSFVHFFFLLDGLSFSHLLVHER